MEDQTITLNQNATQCIRTVSEWGADHIHNICSGTTTTLPWGLGGWAVVGGIGLAGIIGVVMIAMMLAMVVDIFRW
ncbi:hypothetical protein [Devosia sp. SL43]|uniref:hypothetical protein n=1 Tax=Devosia sp. SL43 TaxID=2806348 RepID=UPI001F3C1884|nr:hypothetical protein [Devosia sp. SL43]UJW87926.1 hypothetical protein IM737_20810 [Devosia sp. SL43]